MSTLEKKFSGYFHAHYRPLCLHALHFMESADEAEDVVQETFLNLWDKKEQMGTIKSVKSYLYTAVRNNCLTRLRDAKPTTPLDSIPQEALLSAEALLTEEASVKRAETDITIHCNPVSVHA